MPANEPSENDASRTLVDRLRQVGALKDGHFLLSSGKHSDQYVEKFDLLRRPAEVEAVCSGFVRQFRDQRIDVVVGPTTGGILLAFEVARQLRIPAAYAERRSDGSTGREIRRGTTFDQGARVLVVDDILTTGGSIRETLAALVDHQVSVAAVAVLVDRSNGQTRFSAPLVALAQFDIQTWSPEECPLCTADIPLIKPGTTTLTA